MTYEEALRKAMACLRLAERGGTPAESAAAAAKAQKIIDDYKIDVSALDFDQQQKAEDDEPIKDFGFGDPIDEHDGGNYTETWTRRLAWVIARANQCRTIYTKTMKTRYSIAIKIIGRASDVSAVRYLYAYFKAEVLRLEKANTKGNSTAYRGQFCLGVIDTLEQLLKAEKEKTFGAKRDEMAGNPMALVRVNNAIARLDRRSDEVDKFVAEQKLAGKGRAKSYRAGLDGRSHGQREGFNIRMTSARGGIGNGSARKGIN